MAFSPVRAAALAERLEIPLDGICLACLSFVSSAVRTADEGDIRLWVRRMTPDLWHDGLDEIALRYVGAAAAEDGDAAEAYADLVRDGPASAMARAIVFDLGRRLAADEAARDGIWTEVTRNGDGFGFTFDN
ncbi:MAG TPA: hypothetical protein VGU02_11710 [Gaiellaceae bacterium]|nr:hypothetical protein [Gaiellaceae bacterium]